jgi:hypothetical protein
MEQLETVLSVPIHPVSTTCTTSLASDNTFKISSFVETLSKTSKVQLKSILSLLTKLLATPAEKKNRVHRLDNLAIKKMVEPKGSMELFEAIGFQQVESKGLKYLQIEQEVVNADLLKSAIDIISSNLNEVEAVPVGERPKVLCEGKCGFFGNAETENLCSKCYKIKHPISGAASASAAAPATIKPKVLCVAKCGFFGDAATENMCSKCHKVKYNSPKMTWRKKWRRATVKVTAYARFKSFVKPILQVDTSTCWKCSRRVGTNGIECRCRYTFCGEHRYFDTHDCPFDVKKKQRQILAKQIIKVQDDKFTKMTD